MSVLDAKKASLDSQIGEAEGESLGAIKLFTLKNDKKQSSITLTGETMAQAEENEKPRGGSHAKPEAKSAGRDRAGLSSRAGKHRKDDGADNKNQGSKKIDRKKKESSSKKAESVVERRSFGPKKAQKKATHQKEKEVPEKTPEQKIAERKARRRARRILLAAVSALLFVTAMVVGFNVAYESYRVQQGKIAVLDNGIAQISVADENLARLNDALADPTTDDAIAVLTQLKIDLPQSQIALQRALSLLERGEVGLENNRDVEMVYQAKQAINARNLMIESGLSLADKILKARSSQSYVDSLWNKVLAADGKARANATLLLNPTKDNLNAALAGMSEVESEFRSVRDEMIAADNDDNYINLRIYEDYLDKRIAAVVKGEEAVTALINEDLSEARAKQEEYSHADEVATEAAGNLPTKPSDLIAEKYTLDAQSDIETYSNARHDAGTADAKLRNYYSS